MNDQLLDKLEERLLPLLKRIEQLEEEHTFQGIDAIEHRSAEVDDIASRLDALAALALETGDTFARTVEKRLWVLSRRLKFLPQAPRIEVVRRAQSVLAQNPLILVTDDILDKETNRPELTCIHLIEPTETRRFEYHFAPSRRGKGRLHVQHAAEKTTDATVPPSSLEVAWSDLQSVVFGRYVVAFDLPFAQVQLDVTARRHGLPVPMLVGHSLLDLLLQYAGVKAPISYDFKGFLQSSTDAELCNLMAPEDVMPFYNDSLVPADQRAHHLLHALQKMADGTLSLQEPRFVPPKEYPFSVQKG